MSAPAHLEGMGVSGSFLAWHLAMAGVPFTWHDDNKPHCAWKASTGLVYPSGDPHDMANYHEWQRWVDGSGGLMSDAVADCAAPGAFWFTSKVPPHGGRYPIVAGCGPLRLGSLPSYHLNVQAFVKHTRILFAAQERTGPMPGSRLVITHGYTDRCHHLLWGWSARVRLRIHSDILDASNPARPCLYLREGRYRMAYANPVPYTDDYYAGSATFVQEPDHAHELASAPKLEAWQEFIERTSGGLVQVIGAQAPVSGWRPCVGKGIPETVTVRDDGTIVLPPMGTSGVRHAPLLCKEVLSCVS